MEGGQLLCCGVFCFGSQTLLLFTERRQTGKTLSFPNARRLARYLWKPSQTVVWGREPPLTYCYSNKMFFKHDLLKLVSELRPHSTVVLYICIFPFLQWRTGGPLATAEAKPQRWGGRIKGPTAAVPGACSPGWMCTRNSPSLACTQHGAWRSSPPFPSSCPPGHVEQSWALLQGLTEQAAPIPRPHQTWQEASHAGNSYDPVKKDNDPISLWQEWSLSNFPQQELSQLNNSIPLEVVLSQCRNLQNAFFIATALPFYSTFMPAFIQILYKLRKHI